MSESLFIDTEINRDMMATDIEKLLYDMVTLLKANVTTEESNDE